MPTYKSAERDEDTADADGVPDAIVPRLSMTARDVVTLRFRPRSALLRREWNGCGGAFHVGYELSPVLLHRPYGRGSVR